jgi:hypothetical protein
MAFTVILGSTISSVKYNNCREGKAKNNKIKAGKIVQMVSTA